MISNISARVTGIAAVIIAFSLFAGEASALIPLDDIDCHMEYKACCFVDSQSSAPTVNPDIQSHPPVLLQSPGCPFLFAEHQFNRQIPVYNYLVSEFFSDLESLRLLC